MAAIQTTPKTWRRWWRFAVSDPQRLLRSRTHRRQDEILALLKSQGSMSVAELAERIGCSQATIRRDLKALRENTGVRRFHGAVAVEAIAMEPAFQERLAVADAEKRAIARRAVEFLQETLKPGSVVGLNGGTTTTQIAHQIAEVGLNVTVVTNAVNIAFALTSSRIPVVVVGGMLLPANYETTGPLAVEALKNLHLDVVILGTNGLDLRFGASTHAEAEAAVGRIFSEQADTVIIAADASKCERTALFRMVEWDRIGYVVADDQAARIFRTWPLQPLGIEGGAGLWKVGGHGL